MPILNYDSMGDGPHRLYVLHGIFGAGRNWASIARRVVRERPEWTVRLLDLRQHGGSQGFPPPHTLAAAAADIDYLARQLGEQPDAVLGHSFGGKVALLYARTQPPKQVWLIDSTPEARPPEGTAWEMVQLVRNAPREYESRDQLVDYLGQHGIAAPTAAWMATNLAFVQGRYRWRFNLDSIEALLTSFFEADLWDVIETPPVQTEVHVVKATDSSVLSPGAAARVRAAGSSGRVHYHEVAGGHWLNADNPDAITQLLTHELPGRTSTPAGS